jgi:hypothetical protein
VSERKDFRTLRDQLEKQLEADPEARERYETERRAMRDAQPLGPPRAGRRHPG